MWWFVDNEAAAASAIRGTTPEADVRRFVQVAHLLWLEFEIRVWIEWIDSQSNPSDGLSRDGLADGWSVKQGWTLSQAFAPDWDGADPDAVAAMARLRGTLA